MYQRQPQMVISRFLYVIWTALTPYVGIFLSALIIDELAGSRNVQNLQMLVLITLVSAAVISLASALLNKWTQAQNAGEWLKMEKILTEKMMELDYSALDESHTAEQLSTIRQNLNGGGWGLYRVIESYEKLGSSLFTILGGLALTVSLFVSRVPDTAGALVWLNHPLVVISIIAFMLGITFLAPVLQNQSESYYAKYADSHNQGNRLFCFFGYLGYYREFALDMRMYCQNRICDRYNRNKEGTFGSKGLFAHLARGSMGLYAAASGAVSVLFTGVAYLFVCLKALAGAFGLGSVTQYVASISKVSSGVSSLVSALGLMRNNAAFLCLTFDFLDIPNNMYQGSLTVEKRNDRKYQVEFRNVSFRYPGSDNYTLRHVNMKFEIGKRLAVVGMNGSGKTTFIKLLCRLYDPTEGEILLNGIDIRKYNYREYMNIFSIVFQDFQLLALKLEKNVASQVHYNREKVLDCLKKLVFLKDWPIWNLDWIRICTKTMTRMEWIYLAERPKRLPLPVPCIRTPPLLFWTSPLQRWTPLRRQRSTASLIRLLAIKPPSTSATDFQAVNSAMKSLYSTREQLFSEAPTMP